MAEAGLFSHPDRPKKSVKTVKTKNSKSPKPVPKKVAETAVPSSERGALFAEEAEFLRPAFAFDAETFAHRFRYGDFTSESVAVPSTVL
eukprot:Skav230162  [mRNA]  locus=scaffold996:112882:114539:- [translate_table: standard]